MKYKYVISYNLIRKRGVRVKRRYLDIQGFRKVISRLISKIVLASLVVAVIVSLTLGLVGIDFGMTTKIVSALSNTPTVLNRGEVLQPDMYASVGSFSVPQSVGQDFADNATTAVVGSIRPYFSGPTYVIPSAKSSNAIAVFNQPLDPTKDFSISAKITVPDARIAVAGIYISDIAPADIVTKLGTKAGNTAGSSGALNTETNSYSGHYMLFSGFHNESGYAAILASGTDYTRVNGSTSSSGNSKYMDHDYVSFGTNRDNVTIMAAIEYRASTGIVSVVFQHNSATTNGGSGVYDKNTKSAVATFRLNNKSPIYLGIVGNGNRDDNSGAYTSRTTVNSVTGTYLSTTRNVEFKDDAGNALMPFSKILMPRGAILGIGNNDTKAQCYYKEPLPPQGYTYIANQNPSVGLDRNLVVKYQRDKQQGSMSFVNQLTGKVLDHGDWDALTNQVINNTRDALQGYYVVDNNAVVGRGVSNVSTSSDGAKVSWTNTIDNTPNGTSSVDSDPQDSEIYLLPSIQERILTITKPDGTTATEKQISTTDTDFPVMGGQYAIKGYRAVIDKIPVGDSEANQGIPGEATDKTHNLKATIDSQPQQHTVTYQAETQKATIVYKDLTTGKILKTDNISGPSNTLMTYDTASVLGTYISKGYIVKTNNFKDGTEKYNDDTSQDQNYTVELIHNSIETFEKKLITHEVNYTVDKNLFTPPTNYAVSATITLTYFVDQVTGDKIISQLTDYAANGSIKDHPSLPKYESDHTDATVDVNGLIKFTSPVVPLIQGYVAKVSENTSIDFSKAKDGDKLVSTILYQLDDTINVTLPINTIFYNTLANKSIKSPVYKITNNSGVPVKVSLNGFVADSANSAIPTDFELNIAVFGNKVKQPITKLFEKGAMMFSTSELITLANCLDQYTNTDASVAMGTAVNNVATFKYDGSATTSGTHKLGYTLNLKFDKMSF